MKRAFRFRTLVGTSFLPVLAAAGVAHAGDDQEFEARLSGAQEVVIDEQDTFVPGGVDTDASGRIEAEFNQAFSRLRVHLRIDNLTGAFAAAHFHCGRPGENGPVAFGLVNPGPLGFDGKRIRGTLTNADYTGADCVAVIGRPVNNLVSLAFAMRDGLVYANVHSDIFPAGEIRGQMLPDDDDRNDD